MMILGRASLAALLCVMIISLAADGWAQEIKYREEPISLEEMKDYKDIPFKQENFEKITNGMTEKDVLSLLGKPLDMKKMQRKGHRWTFHYYYPEGYTVNFRNGLVVGKEKQ
jgi:outer membrane protein assembly factor BamE (lipoprotein component of BamABCDE complex)